MRRKKNQVSSDISTGASRQLLSLSLFIVLLAFFIVLNGVSSFDEGKVRDTMDSVGFAFGTSIEAKYGLEGDLGSQTAHTDEDQTRGSVFDRMQALFNANIPGHKAVLSKSNGILHIAIPLEEFEQALDKSIEAGGRVREDEISDYIFDALIALMNRDDDGIKYRMDVYYNLRTNPAELFNKSPQEFNTQLNRSSGLARKIEQIGLPENLMSISMSKGNPAVVDLYFTIHQVHEVDADASGP